MPLQPCACGIDVHAHVVPAHFPRYLGSRTPSPWPSTDDAPSARGLCHRQVMVGGQHYRTLDERSWSVPHRLADLPAMGLAAQVVSPMPELLGTWLDLADAQPLIRFLNEHTAALCAQAGGRLLGLAAVPLQDVDAAIAELRHAVQTLGLVGVELGSNVNGLAIGHPRFEPFFEACVALDVPVFVHALRPAGMDRLVGPAPRQQGWGVFPALKDSIAESPAQQARRLFFDTLVFDAPTLRHLVASFGAQALMLGTDYPFNFHERAPLARLHEAGLDAATQQALAQGNARRFLGRAGAAIPETA